MHVTRTQLKSFYSLHRYLDITLNNLLQSIHHVALGTIVFKDQLGTIPAKTITVLTYGTALRHGI